MPDSQAPRPVTIPMLFEASVERFADNVLVRERHDGTWQDTTYGEVRALVHRCAAGLRDLGLAKGDRVALISEGRREWPVSELGILYAGAINVPISVKIEELGELKFRLAHAGCRMVHHPVRIVSANSAGSPSRSISRASVS